MTPDGAVRLVTVTTGGPLLTATAIGILVGQSVNAAEALLARTGVASAEFGIHDKALLPHLPAEWLKAGRRRAREAMAACQTENAMGAFWYWVSREWPRHTLWQNDEGLWLAPRQVDG